MVNSSPLDWLAERAGGCFLSDLRAGVRAPAMTRRLKQILPLVPSWRWDLRDWNDVGAYLLGRPCSFSSVEHAAEELVKML